MPSPLRAARSRLLVATVLAILVLLPTSGRAGASRPTELSMPATVRQVEDDTTSTSSTEREVLVPGDGTDGAQVTTTTSAAEPSTDDGDDEVIDESTMIWLIVAGLVLIALLIGLWTVRYWRATRPQPASSPGLAPPSDGGRRGRRSPEDPTTVFPTRR